jgi:MOSC domain-containing protein YiiM
MTEAGTLEQIWVKRFKGGPMDPVDTAILVAGEGLENNADQRLKRQVTILEKEVWERVTREAGITVDPSARRANLLVSNISLSDSRHKILCIGSSRIKIHGETKPCRQMDEISPGLREIMWPDWAGGAYGEVLTGGPISLSDLVGWALQNETLDAENRRTPLKANQTG